MAGEPLYYYTPVRTIPYIGVRKGMTVSEFSQELAVRGYKFQEVLNVIQIVGIVVIQF